MAPLRRYLRITKYSVLECRIYVDNPALVQSWLLHPRDPVLPRVIESVRPLVLPKLMEERERAKKKATKKKGAIRDVLVEEDFEVSLFLTETNTRHSLLYKHRRARDKTQTRLISNSTKLTGGTSDAPIDVEDGSGNGGNLRVEIQQDRAEDSDGSEDIVLTAAGAGAQNAAEASRIADQQPPNLLLEDSDEEAAFALQDIPDVHDVQASDDDGDAAEAGTRRSKRRRQRPVQVRDSDEEEQDLAEDESDDDSLFGSELDGSNEDEARPPKRSRVAPMDVDVDDLEDGSRKKKKLAMDVIYEGFAIYGRVLCLIVKQRGPPRGRAMPSLLTSSSNSGRTAAPAKPVGQAAMENWIASTQLPPGGAEADIS